MSPCCSRIRPAAASGLLAAFAAVALPVHALAEEPAPPPVTRLTRTHYSKLFLSYSPDGSHLSYSRHHNNRRAANKVLVGLRIVKADGTDDRPLLPEFEQQVQIQEHGAWSPDGKSLLLSGGGNDTGNSAKDTFICDIGGDFKASALRKLIPGEGVRVGEQPAWSPNGKEVVVVTIDHALWVFDAGGKGKHTLFQGAGHYCFQPAWSPDGEWIAFASDRDGDPEVYKIRPDGTELTRLTHSRGIDCRPRWSPDAQWLVFTSNRTGNDDLFLMRADGSGVRNLTQNPAVDDHAAWAPDGQSIAFVSMRDGGFDLYRMPVPRDVRVARTPPPVARPPAEDPGSLVAHYDFDHDAGPLVRDERTGRKSLELFGARVVGDRGRGALAFNGKDSYASCGNRKALQLSGPLTISLWVRSEQATGNGYLASKQGWNIYLGPDLLPRFETRTAADNGWDTLAAADRVAAGQWSFVAAVFDPAKKVMQLYVDGKRSGSKPRTDGRIGGTEAYPLELGTYVVSRSQWFQGQLDEVRLYKRALGADEIAREFKEQSGKVIGK
jgi:TolB protein